MKAYELKQFDLHGNAKDATFNRYEVLKTRSGAEIVGMTRDTRDHVGDSIAYDLSFIDDKGLEEVSIFYPLNLSAEEKLMI